MNVPWLPSWERKSSTKQSSSSWSTILAVPLVPGLPTVNRRASVKVPMVFRPFSNPGASCLRCPRRLPAAAWLPAARAQLGMAALGGRIPARPSAHIRAVAGHELPLPASTAQGGAIRSLPAASRAPASRRAHSRIVSHGAKRAKTTNTDPTSVLIHTFRTHDTRRAGWLS